MANTSGQLSDALIATMAAGLLDEYNITSLDDDTALGRYMSREYGTVRREILEEYPWRIARTRALLTELGTAPAFGWCAQYQLPSNQLRVHRLTHCGTPNGTPIAHKVEGTKLLCNTKTSIKLLYIKDETNVALWTALMGRAFAGKMAMYASQNVTGKQGYFEKCRTAYMDAALAAKLADALAEGSEENVWRSDYDGFDSANVRGNGYGAGVGPSVTYR